jgi:chromosome segregation ATPase
MTVITAERLTAANGLVNNLIERGQALFADISETAHDHARLQKELGESQDANDRLTVEVRDLRAKVKDYEDSNSRLIEELNTLESRLEDATARLESISQTARLDGPSSRSDEPTPAAIAGLNALRKLSNNGAMT